MLRSTVSLLIAASLLVSTATARERLSSDGNAGYPVSDFALVDNVHYIDGNSILMFVTNHGNFGRDLSDVFGYDYGTFFPYYGTAWIYDGSLTTSPLYAAGLWIGGKVNGQTRVAVAEYSDEFVPGPMENGTYQPDNNRFKVYKLYRDSLAGSPGSDYLNWPVYQGAPVDSLGQPAMRGNQMLWTVFNDADPLQHSNDAGETAPLGIEVQQTVWADDGESFEGVSLYTRYTLINRGVNTVDSCFVALWSDPDLGGAGDDLVGCVPDENIMFCYNSTNMDQQYGSRPPAIGFKLISGPVVPDPGRMAFVDGEVLFDRAEVGIYSFNKYINGTDPDNFGETYNYMRGLNADGSPYMYMGLPTRFVNSGDPVTGFGDLDTAPSDKRMMGSYGPFTFNPGDTQTIVVKMAVAPGPDRLSSITLLREILNYDPNAPLSASTIADPDPIPPLPKLPVYFYLGNLEGGTPVTEIDPGSILLNGVLAPDSVVIVSGVSGFSGDALRLRYRIQNVEMLYAGADFYQLQEFAFNFEAGQPKSFVARGYLSFMELNVGDLTGDGAINLTDLTTMVNYMFIGGPAPHYLAAADTYCDGTGRITLTDLTRLVNYLFLQGPRPELCDYWITE